MKVKALVVLVILATGSIIAQQAEAAKDAQPAAKAEKPVRHPYRFEYSLTELSGKQKINTRKFDFLTSNRGELHASSKLAVPTGSFRVPSGGERQYQYVDTGLTAEMNFDPRTDGEIDLHIQVNMTFVVNPEAPAADSPLLPPAVRTINMQIDSRIKAGVPTVLGTVEDVASTHSYELTVTANPR